MTKVVAKASANIALVKYWGKSDESLNLPAVDSISVTLAGLDTLTSVEPIRDSACLPTGDVVTLAGKPMQDAEAARVRAFIDLFRTRMDDTTKFHVQTENHFPTGAGLASSASGFAALGAALASYYGWTSENLTELINIVRQGSGSAPRSLLRGFVHLARTEDGITLNQIHTPLYDDLAILVCIVDEGRKAISSRQAMQRSLETSPLWEAWLQVQQQHIEEALQAIPAGDFDRLGALAEQDAQCMHATCHTAWPPVYYWRPASVELLRQADAWRGDGMSVYCTMDAGPQVKMIVRRADVPQIKSLVEAAVPGVRTLVAYPGPGAFDA